MKHASITRRHWLKLASVAGATAVTTPFCSGDVSAAETGGIVETRSLFDGAPNQLSFYVSEAGRQKNGNRLRRYTLRIDGFVSVKGPLAGGELITKPLCFEGGQLQINFSTSAAGSVAVEIQDQAGKPVPGFALANCHLQYGDQLDRVVSWKSGADVSRMVGKPVKLRFHLKDADLYAFRFAAGD